MKMTKTERRALIKSFVGYYRPYRGTLTCDLLCAFVFSLCGLAYPILTRHILNVYLPMGREATLPIIGFSALLFCIYLLRAGMDYYVCYYGHRMGVKMQADMRRDLFAHLERLPYGFYDNTETGQLMSRMTNDLFNVIELAHHGPENVFITTFMTLGAFAYLCYINWKLALIIIAFLPLMMLLTVATRRKMHAAFALSKQKVGEINASLENSIAGIRVTRAYDNAAYEEARFATGNVAFAAARTKAYRAMAAFHTSMGFLTGFYNVVVLVAGLLFITYDAAHFDYVDLVAFMLSINLLVSPINQLVLFVEQFEDGVTGYRRFYEILQIAPETDVVDPETVDIAGDIEIDHLHFAYREGHEILSDINLHIPRGKTFALVGASGGGKTTLCHLIPKFYPVTEGDIRIDGVSVNRIANSTIRRSVGIVQQDVFLFTGTFRENIAYGRPGSAPEEIEAAARRAHIHDFIMSLPMGYDTPVGEHGVKLSGGQKQRVAIARVFLKDPAILILDEATSALDNATETMIQRSLDDLMQGRTSLVVAHRLTTIQNADCIVVMEKGRIVEMGTHDELMQLRGAYYTLRAAVDIA